MCALCGEYADNFDSLDNTEDSDPSAVRREGERERVRGMARARWTAARASRVVLGVEVEVEVEADICSELSSLSKTLRWDKNLSFSALSLSLCWTCCCSYRR